MDASHLLQDMRAVRVIHRAAHSCTGKGAASGAVDNSADEVGK